jgi:uncharacterized Zn ribbon protein
MTNNGLCPECNEYIGDDVTPMAYCPNCGADLSDYEDEDLEDDHEFGDDVDD